MRLQRWQLRALAQLAFGCALMVIAIPVAQPFGLLLTVVGFALVVLA